jgi:hypothetical protein
MVDAMSDDKQAMTNFKWKRGNEKLKTNGIVRLT